MKTRDVPAIIWIFGGIIKMVLDRFMGVLGIKKEELESVESESQQETDSAI